MNFHKTEIEALRYTLLSLSGIKIDKINKTESFICSQKSMA